MGNGEWREINIFKQNDRDRKRKMNLNIEQKWKRIKAKRNGGSAKCCTRWAGNFGRIDVSPVLSLASSLPRPDAAFYNRSDEQYCYRVFHFQTQFSAYSTPFISFILLEVASKYRVGPDTLCPLYVLFVTPSHVDFYLWRLVFVSFEGN
jgi:hypothetical protein